ncbi:hypothetical protein GO986_11910 [Deinococcus sp. HMF7620]|uniref:Uncharacterized protein n=1 Tax=Deinococcus arboris TaxID=2682977 RepID=A0A7C9HSA9_9DEIO|nr:MULTISPECIES: hypothetical protein [Deinococcus]MBZ9752175.1 hypothetical protein [Deinococcus betulae]MVN87473.1 hypothetical protein [Deinococcus arboris]
MTQVRFARHLAALDQLEPDATPSEQSYYRSLREQYTSAPPRSAASDLGEATLEERASTIDEGHDGLHYWQYELTKPDLDPIWKGWLQDRFDERQAILNQMITELTEEGYKYEPPAFDLDKQRRITELDHLQSRAASLKDLIFLKQAWAERHGKTDQLATLTAPYTAELEEVEAQLKALE